MTRYSCEKGNGSHLPARQVGVLWKNDFSEVNMTNSWVMALGTRFAKHARPLSFQCRMAAILLQENGFFSSTRDEESQV
jgi:hypothetical protein